MIRYTIRTLSVWLIYTRFEDDLKKRRRKHKIRVIEIIVTLLEQRRPSYKLPCSTKFDVPLDRKKLYKSSLYLQVPGALSARVRRGK